MWFRIMVLSFIIIIIECSLHPYYYYWSVLLRSIKVISFIIWNILFYTYVSKTILLFLLCGTSNYRKPLLFLRPYILCFNFFNKEKNFTKLKMYILAPFIHKREILKYSFLIFMFTKIHKAAVIARSKGYLFLVAQIMTKDLKLYLYH